MLLKRGECRTNCNSSDPPPPPPLSGQFIQSQESVCIYNGLHWIGTGIRSLLAFEGILINGMKLANVTSHNGPLNLSDLNLLFLDALKEGPLRGGHVCLRVF